MILEVAAGIAGTIIYQRLAGSIKVWLANKEKEVKQVLEKK